MLYSRTIMTVAAVLVLTAIFTSCRKDGTDPASSGSAPVSKTEQTGETKPDGTSKPNETSKPEETTEPQPTENWVLATDYEFFDKDGNEVSPAPGGDPWSYFDYWTGWDDTQIYDSHGEGFYVTAKVNASRIKVRFGNGDKNGHTNIEIYVDGRLVATHRQKGWGEGYPDGLNQTDIIRVTPGEHTIKVVAGTPAEEGWNGMCVNVIEYVYDENKPTPPTSDVLLPAVIVCMTAASAAVVLKKKHS
ncbi:MAG: hypothetical protein SOT56_00235 [Eubacteriales bacterium]|nr:hypothetical protein [Eubacteriales bacterium]